MDDNLRPKSNCYMSENFPHVVARSEKINFETFFKNTLPHQEGSFFEMISDFSYQEGKFADSIVLVHYTEDHVEQYPYLSTFDSDDFERICKKYPTAYKIEVFNLKNFRELYFSTVYDETERG